MSHPFSLRRGRACFWANVASSLVMMLSVAAQDRDLRTWTSTDQKTIKASLIRSDGKSVLLKLDNGREAEVPLDRLSEPDRAYVSQMESTGMAIEIGQFPVETKIDQNIKIEGGPRVFLTPNFRFETDQGVTKGFIGEASRVFEGTLNAVASLPLGIDPKPAEDSDRFQTLFMSREAFDQALNKTSLGKLPIPAGSSRTVVAGVYLPAEQKVLVPFSSLGVRQEGSRYSLRRTSDTSTLIHEITHQVMHDWLAISPVWFGEGFAEYMSAVPYQNGRFEFKNAEKGLKESLAENFRVPPDRAIPMIHPADMLQMDNQAWQGRMEEYLSALLLVYYFMHLDQPESPGASLAGYLHLLHRGMGETEQFVADYNAEVASFETQRLAFNKAVDEYNKAVAKYREMVADYNRRIEAYNEQVKLGVAPADRIKVGDQPVAPKPPKKPEVPEKLKETPAGGTIDMAVLIHNTARPALLRDREPEELADLISAAYLAKGIEIRMLQPGATYRPRTNPVTPRFPTPPGSSPGIPKLPGGNTAPSSGGKSPLEEMINDLNKAR